MQAAIHAPVHIAGVRFGNALMNGAYIGSKTLEDIERLAGSDAGALVVGSISIKPRKANSGQGYWQHREKFYSLNSFGMPNGGLPYFKKQLPDMVRIAHRHHKPLIANIVGFSKEEFLALIRLAEDAGADMVELNLGCPNVWEGMTQKRIISYHAPLVTEVLTHIAKHEPSIPVCVKISPLPPDTLRAVVKAIAGSEIVRAVTATNSAPNASISTGTRISDEEALAGLTGRALKPISLGVVKQLRELLPDPIAIIGCGGISSANDVSDYLTAGAQAVQLATALVDDGQSAFSRILFQSADKKFG
jgi:dihydroorotate dehydrogenase